MGAIHALDVRGLRKAYKGRDVVKDVTLHIESGEVIGLLGPNGAGKTTSFYMIVGLVKSDAGEILMDGQNLARLPIHRRARLGLSYLPQEASVFRKLSVADNIRAVLQLQHDAQGAPLDALSIENRLQQLLEDLQIAHLRQSMANLLSGGERRRVEIARALATSPRFILLDEPFAGVDPIAVIEIQRIVRFLKERGIGVLITDHNVRETLGICDRAYIISEGSVLASGVPQDIIADAMSARFTLGNISECNVHGRNQTLSRPSNLSTTRAHATAAAIHSTAADVDGRARTRS
jgi:lipopolysaccharide export system ATP-binding protein